MIEDDTETENTNRYKKVQQETTLQRRQSHSVPGQMSKNSSTVRKGIKIGKIKRINKKHSNVEDAEPKIMDQNPLENEALKVDLKVKPFHLITQKITEGEDQKINKIIHQKLKNEVPRIRSNGDRMLYLKKKLFPLKKNQMGESHSLPNRNPKKIKINFLNIEKVELIKMCEQVNESKSNFFPTKKSFAMTSSIGLKKNSDFFEKTIQQNKSPEKNASFRRSFAQQTTKKKQVERIRPFLIPFDRYEYKDFIWKAALCNGYLLEYPQNYPQKFKVYIGKGNNSLLVKGFFRRRSSWWSITDKYQEANFIWTQIKINYIFNTQQNHESIVKNQSQTFQINENIKYQAHRKFMDEESIFYYFQYFRKNRFIQTKLEQSMTKRNKIFRAMKLLNLKKIPKSPHIHNHLPNNYVIGNKKALFYTMRNYYNKTGQEVFDYLPLTFHIQNGLEDSQYLLFLKHFYSRAKNIRALEKAIKSGQENRKEMTHHMESKRNMWIVKPGEFTNRGNGINVCMNLDEIKKILKKQQRHDNGNLKTYILQSYLERPFLYNRRKFDIRHFMMISSIEGRIKGYWYEYGYIRTTSFQYSLRNNYTSIHLTNDAVQKFLPEYGKYEKANKVSYEEFQKYLDREYRGKYDFFSNVLPKMKKIVTDSIRACSLTIDPERKGSNFEIFGLDFMIDEQFHPWLIEINNNPCLEVSCPLLKNIIPKMIENAIRLCVDPLIPPPAKFSEKKPNFTDKALDNNNFQLVYDSLYHQNELIKLFKGQYTLDLDYKQLEKEEDEVFDDDGFDLDEF